MSDICRSFLTRKQALEKFPFLTENMLKNLLFSNPNQFRQKCVRKLGARLLFDPSALVAFIDSHRG